MSKSKFKSFPPNPARLGIIYTLHEIILGILTLDQIFILFICTKCNPIDLIQISMSQICLTNDNLILVITDNNLGLNWAAQTPSLHSGVIMHGPLSPRVLFRYNWPSTVSRLEIDVETVLVVLNRDFQMKDNVHTLSVLRRLSYCIVIRLSFSIVSSSLLIFQHSYPAFFKHCHPALLWWK